MKKLGFLLLAFFLCFPFVGSAQNVETEDFDSLVAKFNAECPITSGENWALTSFATAGDTVLIELQVPASLGGFMSLLTADTDNVKRLWVRELNSFGEQWKTFVTRLIEADRPVRLYFTPKGGDIAAEIVLRPSDFKNQ